MIITERCDNSRDVSCCNSVVSVSQPIFYIPQHPRLVINGVFWHSSSPFLAYIENLKCDELKSRMSRACCLSLHRTQTGKLKPIGLFRGGMRTLETLSLPSKWLAWNITLHATVLTSTHCYSAGSTVSYLKGPLKTLWQRRIFSIGGRIVIKQVCFLINSASNKYLSDKWNIIFC